MAERWRREAELILGAADMRRMHLESVEGAEVAVEPVEVGVIAPVRVCSASELRAAEERDRQRELAARRQQHPWAAVKASLREDALLVRQPSKATRLRMAGDRSVVVGRKDEVQ